MTAITSVPTKDTLKPTVAEDETAENGQPIDVARLLRLQGSLAALVAELRTIPEGSVRASRLWSVTQKLLAEADGVVPPELLGELHRLIPLSPSADETERNLRLVLGALEAWMGALTAQCGIVFLDPIVSPVDDRGDGLAQRHGIFGSSAVATPCVMVTLAGTSPPVP